MFEIYTSTTAQYEENQPITFTTTRFSDARITSTDSLFTLKTPGRYLISFTGVGSSGTAASPFSVQLYKNGIAVPGASSTITSTAAGDEETLSIFTVLQVRPSCYAVNNTTTLQVMVTSAQAGTLYSGNLLIVRL